MSYIRGTYYLFYALSVSGSQTSAIGYATSSTMEPGSWTDHGAVIESSSSTTNYNAIDPNLINGTSDDEFYLQWGSYWGQIYQARVSISGDYIFASGNQNQIAYNPSNSNTEGATMWLHDGYYYLFLSRGTCCTYSNSEITGAEYHVVVCRATSPTGTFYDKSGTSCLSGGGTTILASHDEVYAPGGQGVFTDPTYGDVMYYHYRESRPPVSCNSSPD